MFRLPMLLHFSDAVKSINLMIPTRLFAEIFGEHEALITCNKRPGSQLTLYMQMDFKNKLKAAAAGRYLN